MLTGTTAAGHKALLPMSAMIAAYETGVVALRATERTEHSCSTTRSLTALTIVEVVAALVALHCILLRHRCAAVGGRSVE